MFNGFDSAPKIIYEQVYYLCKKQFRMYYFKMLFIILLCFTACNSGSQAENATYQNLNVAEFREKLSVPGVVILDVRTPAETAQGKVANALEIDIQSPNFKQQIEALDKDKTYLVYCKAGGRSARACSAMQEMGFNELYNLEGGFTAFSAAE